jgi:hypothetical protein
MQVLVIYAVYEHISELMAEADARRLARDDKPKRSIRGFVASLFASRSGAPAPAAS